MDQVSRLEYKLRYDKEVPIADVQYRIFLQRKQYEHFIIVEGTSDIPFYYYTNTLKGINNFKIISAPEENIDKIVGKKYVINVYQILKKDKYHSKEMNKYVFIVDHDYDGIEKYYNILEHRFVVLSKQEQNCISCTKYYAIENYFLTYNNLKIIFGKFGIIDQLTDFINEFKKLVIETKEYFSLMATTMYAVKNNIKLNRLNIKTNDIFKDFKFKEKYLYKNRRYTYNRELLEKAISERKDTINKSIERNKLYKIKKQYEKLIEEENYIQGHAAYNFLKCYLWEFFKINIKQKYDIEDYRKILEEINVEIELKYGNGKKIV